MDRTKLIILGGFPGAGKTTCIASIAKYLTNNLKKVGIVTNDRGSHLVDTNFFRGEGLPVLEVSGGSICCNFNEFVDRVQDMRDTASPDVILVEAVGSCTDLVATVFKPIQACGALDLELGPLSIVADPRRLRKLMLQKEKKTGWDELGYLFEKQLEEADFILLNKVDTLLEAEQELMLDFLRRRYQGAVVLPTVANSMQSLGGLVPFLVGARAPEKRSMAIDYATYGRAEQSLSWLNARTLISGRERIDWNDFLIELMEEFREAVRIIGGEMAHIKLYAICGNDYARASLTGMEEDTGFSRCMETPVKSISLLINARVGMEPSLLREAFEEKIQETCGVWDAVPEHLHAEVFKPGWPDPTHRIAG